MVKISHKTVEGVNCATRASQQILKNCPSSHFCHFPQGEICVYGLDDVQQMIQIKAMDLMEAAGPFHLDISGLFIIAMISCLIGILMGGSLKK